MLADRASARHASEGPRGRTRSAGAADLLSGEGLNGGEAALGIAPRRKSPLRDGRLGVEGWSDGAPMPPSDSPAGGGSSAGNSWRCC